MSSTLENHSVYSISTLKYKELQKLCKANGIKANSKADVLRMKLIALIECQVVQESEKIQAEKKECEENEPAKECEKNCVDIPEINMDEDQSIDLNSEKKETIFGSISSTHQEE